MLLELAARPKYQPLLRDEIRQVVLGEGVAEEDKEGGEAKGGGGWSLASIDRLHKLDSFMCETRRLRPMSDSTAPFPSYCTLFFPLPHSSPPLLAH